MPDDELFLTADRTANCGENLESQVKRMLKSPKAISLTKDFMGQWLEIRGLDKTSNCPPELLTAMKGETEHYFNYIVQEDRSIMEFLDSRLHVCEPDARGTLWHQGGHRAGNSRRCRWIPTQRGGIFTQASFLTLTAKPLGTSRRTSPGEPRQVDSGKHLQREDSAAAAQCAAAGRR